MNKILGGLDRQRVHHLQSGRDDPCGDNIAHRLTGFLHIVECGQDHLRAFRFG